MDDISERKLLTSMLSVKTIPLTLASGFTAGAANLAYQFGPIVFVSLNYTTSTVTTSGTVVLSGLPKPLIYNNATYAMAVAVSSTGGGEERLALTSNGELILDGAGIATYVNGSFCYVTNEW